MVAIVGKDEQTRDENQVKQRFSPASAKPPNDVRRRLNRLSWPAPVLRAYEKAEVSVYRRDLISFPAIISSRRVTIVANFSAGDTEPQHASAATGPS
jgi:hypothetical protein